MATTERSVAIEVRNIWKVFGSRARQAMEAILRDNLSKAEVRDRFGCVVGVRDASFTVGRGEIFCIMGLSGSGKSTLIRHINRLIEPTHGTIHIEGRNVSAMNARDLRALRAEQIGMVFQNMALMPHRTVRDNVAFSLEVRGRPDEERARIAARAIDAVDLTGWEAKYPDELSGGMQQRVGLARAIAADPSILLMDEPFSALDPLIRRQLQDVFIDLAARMHKTTVFITHDLDEAIRIGHRIAIMKDGVLVQVGTPEEIVTRPADAYVADFVAGISKLDLVTAGRIMQPLGLYERENGPLDAAGWPVARPGDTLNALVDLAVGSDHPILVSEGAQRLGVVTKGALLRGIQGRSETNTLSMRGAA
ncbi:quaternary amine ABC transporter ATP-binding protein [Rubellimicrobium arenae]|uniref:quaternary amine ABC transporter ATP-binding protein n=1 Tax=Rubellimicrobium arenae TaxID=2817372 RepID=UPI001B306B73|nr:glycine betaine/L-proline ABC transporter ATP-binding protein [Rubellimicrobium arenae]